MTTTTGDQWKGGKSEAANRRPTADTAVTPALNKRTGDNCSRGLDGPRWWATVALGRAAKRVGASESRANDEESHTPLQRPARCAKIESDKKVGAPSGEIGPPGYHLWNIARPRNAVELEGRWPAGGGL